MQRPQATRRQLTGISVAALIAAAAPVVPVLAADPVEVSFSPTGVEQQWTVPSGVTSIHVVLVGARGANDAASAGRGHVVAGDLAVTAGSTLYVEVGGDGSQPSATNGGAGGFNGGGRGGNGETASGAGGGGATDIRTVPRASGGSVNSRLIVAAGGGGQGAGSLSGGAIPPGGAGGAAGTAGANGQNGNGTVGFGGNPGTSTDGGAGGLSAGGTLDGGKGGAGVAGTGGDGASSSTVVTFGGGGAGGGYYGGGGGGASQAASGAGGGGGSSFTGDATNASVTANATTAGASVVITYTPGAGDPSPEPNTGIVDADVTVPISAACVELSTTSISFGTQRFGTEDAAATPGITVTNCSGTDESLLASVSAAAGTGATWTPIDTPGSCAAGTLGIDEFHLKINRPANEVDPLTLLGPDNKEIAELAGGADADLDALLDMPCAGSSGAGQTMGMNIVFVVTEIE